MTFLLANLFRFRFGLRTTPPPSGGGGGGGGVPPPIVLSASFVEVGVPKVLVPTGYLANLTSDNIPSNKSSTVEAPNGFMLRTIDNTVQWDGMSRDQAGLFTINLSDDNGATHVATAIDIRMRLHNAQVEVIAGAKCPVGWLLGVPTGVTPSMTGAGGKFELASYTCSDGKTHWWVRTTGAALSVGDTSVSISAPGCTTITPTISVVADTGAHGAWPTPIAPTAPDSPLTTQSSVFVLSDSVVKDRISVNAGVTLAFKQNATPTANGATMSNITGDGIGLLFRQYGGQLSGMSQSKIRVTNAIYVRGIGLGLFGGAATGKNVNLSFTDLYWQSTTAIADKASDIFGTVRLAGKDPSLDYGGDFTIARLYSSGMRMASVDYQGKAISYPNADGASIEMFKTQLGLGIVTDIDVNDCSDAGLDIKCPLGTVISRLRANDCRETVKDWNDNIFEYVISTTPRYADVMRMCIPSEANGKLRRFKRPLSVFRQIYSDTLNRPDGTACPLIKQEIGASGVIVQKMEIPVGKKIADATVEARPSLILVPDGTAWVWSGTTLTNVTV
jgi:hypothetical protein